MAKKLQRRWFQFSLRSALAASFLFALFLGWWFRPFVMETHRQDGSLRRQFTVCRDWRGGLVSHGKQTWVFSDGTRFETTSYGLPLDKNELNSLLSETQRNDIIFDDLIELITTTLEFGSGQVVTSDGGTPR